MTPAAYLRNVRRADPELSAEDAAQIAAEEINTAIACHAVKSAAELDAVEKARK